ncbi:ATP-binding cassette, sub-B (MDR TAP), member 4, partial [Physocladia obscura]
MSKELPNNNSNNNNKKQQRLPWLRAENDEKSAAKELVIDVPAASDATTNQDSPSSSKSADPTPPRLPFFSLFKYADLVDKLLFLFGTVFAVGAGSLSPFLFLVFGNLLGAFSLITTNPDSFTPELNKYILYFVYLGIASFFLNYVGTLCWRLTGERQSVRIRTKFLQSVLHQDVSWFDERRSGDLASRLSTDTFIVQTGISEKIGLALLYLSSFLASFIVAYTQGWKMALVITAAVPALAVVLVTTFTLIAKLTNESQTDYSEAGALATEILGAVRTVYAFGGQNREGDEYEKLLQNSQGIRRKKLVSTGIGFGMVNLMIYAFIALGLWYGATLLVSGEYSGQNVLIIFFTLLIGSFSIGNLGPYATAFASAQGAAYELYSIIDRKPSVVKTYSNNDEPATKIPRFSQEIEFKNVSFHYASRPDVQVLKNLNLKIPYGKTVALVGSSGSGKSTIVQMLQRFYDPVEGGIFIDGVNIKNADIRSFRDQLGVVSQEPVLFRYTVKENIRFGKLNASNEEIESAARAANAFNFINELPNGFESDVGERGSLLSGGQKQRVAIARAIIKNPPILLLDEATSALDSQSEAVVQEALDKVSIGRTTVVVAHRLSTIKDADVIVVLEKGEVVEIGTHQELLSRKGRYNELVSLQDLKKNENGDESVAISSSKGLVTDVIRSSKYLKSDSSVAVVEDLETGLPASSSTEVPVKEGIKWSNLVRLFGYNLSQVHLLVVAAVASTGLGLAFPLYSVFFGKLIAAFFDPNVASVQDQINTWCLIFVIIGIAGFFATFVQIVFIGLYGSNIFIKVRVLAIRNILRQEIGWFDEPLNNSSNLGEILGKDVETLASLMDQTIGQTWSSIINAIAGTIIGFYYSWKLTLVNLALLPIASIGVALETEAQFGSNDKTKKSFEEATFIANEAIFNIRTVVSLGLEDFFLRNYTKELDTAFKVSYRSCFIASFGPAFAQCSQFFNYAVSYYVGGILVKNGEITFQSMNIVIQSVFFMALAIGQVGALTPNITKALLSANKVFKLIDRVTLMDTTVGAKVAASEMTGDVALEAVEFSYPTRTETSVLKGIDMNVKAGMTVGLVGASGCGKSTIVNLVMRFYDPTSGRIAFGGSNSYDAKDRQLESLREFMAVVSQE